MTHSLYRIVAPHFVCGIILQHGKVMQCAPIVKYMLGWTISNVSRYCERKGWECEPVPEQTHDVELSSDQHEKRHR